jgi:hypothetical protein
MSILVLKLPGHLRAYQLTAYSLSASLRTQALIRLAIRGIDAWEPAKSRITN